MSLTVNDFAYISLTLLTISVILYGQLNYYESKVAQLEQRLDDSGHEVAYLRFIVNPTAASWQNGEIEFNDLKDYFNKVEE